MAKAFRIPIFGGMVPRAGRRHLSDAQAQVATNARLTSGQLEPLHDTSLVSIPGVTGLQAVYKMVQEGLDYWLGWDSDVDAAKGPIAGDETNRTYFTGAGEPRVTDFDLATAAEPYPNGWYVLGVTPPVTAASVSHSGGTGTAVDRAFRYTFVTQWGEESAPSPPSAIVTGKTDGTWTVDGMDTAPPNSYTISAATWSSGVLTLTVDSTFGLRAGEYVTLSGLAPDALNVSWQVASVPDTTTFTIEMDDPGTISDQTGTATRDAPHNTTGMTKNIYWTESSVSGTQYQLVKSGVPVADVSTDVEGDTTPEEELPTTDWEMPPVDLQGLLFHPSGAAVGFSKNQLCFSEPYAPYAWPPLFRFTTDYDIVGIGIFGTTVVVATKGNPYIASGAAPETVILNKVDQPWPCLSKRGVVSYGFGVMYPAPHGLVMIGVNGPEMVTNGLYTEEQWESLQPATFRAAPYGDRYVASYDPDGSGNRQLIIIDRGEFAAVTLANEPCIALYGDRQTGTLYLINDDQVFEWDAHDAPYLTYDWMSKEVVSPDVFNPGAAKVDADFTMTPEEVALLEATRAAQVAANDAMASAGNYDIEGAVGEYEVGGVSFPPIADAVADQLQFQLWINNELKFTKQVTSSKAFRLPGGYKADAMAVRLTGNVKVMAVVVGETMQSLKNV